MERTTTRAHSSCCNRSRLILSYLFAASGAVDEQLTSTRKTMQRCRLQLRSFVFVALAALFWPGGAGVARAQEAAPVQTPSDVPETPSASDPDPIPVMLPHPEWDRIWISGQANFISQWHPAFHSPYQGKNSLTPEPQDATSRVLTLYTGLRVTHTTEFICDVQEAGGHGLSEALGVAGFFNLDVVRNTTLSRAPYIARLMWHQIIPLGSKKIASDRTPYSLFRELPERRFEFRFGKMGLADFFDLNTY